MQFFRYSERGICVLFDAIRENVENQGVGYGGEILLD
ncbi:hypothetical protein BMS3Abin06_01636 [bacterium BMS3Abin06]|nr:hypothetical protein BMS3Abin06_01636 [bacterium BMS3Abin06]